ncbi:hypothetical protein N8755_05000 [Alphaproteobacteria bacterium]|nr:hypothetical protein [Alphaproteobacteria bacterium]
MFSPNPTSRRQHIRIWFEFYKLSLLDPGLSENIQRSLDFYKPWGDITSVKFDDWWRDHKDLFGITRVEETKRISKHPNSLNVTIPLNQPITNSIKQLRSIIEERQKERLAEMGIDTSSQKTSSVGIGQYEFSKGVEIRGRTLNEILVIYRIWISKGRPPINMDLIKSINETLRSRPKSKWVPMIMIDEEPEDYLNLVRQVRRLINRGKKITESVSKGQFPGKSTLN